MAPSCLSCTDPTACKSPPKAEPPARAWTQEPQREEKTNQNKTKEKQDGLLRVRHQRPSEVKPPLGSNAQARGFHRSQALKLIFASLEIKQNFEAFFLPFFAIKDHVGAAFNLSILKGC